MPTPTEGQGLIAKAAHEDWNPIAYTPAGGVSDAHQPTRQSPEIGRAHV